MPTLRWAKASASSVNPKLRWAKVLAQGTGTTPKLRWANVLAQGAAPVSLQAFSDQIAEALQSVTLTAVPAATSPTPTGYAWRQVSGQHVTYADNGSSITFTAPPVMGSGALVFGVTALLGGQSSPEATVTINMIPHLYWVASSTGWTAITRTAVA